MTLDVHATQLLGALETHVRAGVKVLSLDCFDTLLWRNTASPTDVFYDLQHAPAMRALGIDARLRAQSESLARNLRRVRSGQPEVRLPEIYAASFPELSPERLAELCEAELAAEVEACHAFPPVVELIRAARAAGLRVVIVSDTYFDETQLRRLLASAVPADALRAIERVFCSADARVSKADGLFPRVLADLRVKPDQVLHVGDNPVADVTAARAAGMRALHLVHHRSEVAEILRLQGTALALLDPSARSQTALPSPYRGVFASENTGAIPAHLLGYGGFGPLLHAFGRFIVDELAALRAQGKRPRPLFLMRDAYLPQRVCEAISGGDVGHAVAISRFAAYASSFRGAEDVERYLVRFAGSKRFEDIARQLLLPDGMARDVIAAARKKNRPVEEFLRRLRRPDVLATIVSRSRDYRKRLYRYLEKTAGIEDGDTLVFIDLGYEGTAQRLLEPVFREERGLEVTGRYLLVVGTPGWERSRKGLIDPSNTDERAIDALVDHVAILEDICSADAESVVGYDDAGEAIFADAVIGREQRDQVKPVQDACVRFAADAERYFAATGRPPSLEARRRVALGQMGRLFYLPTQHEITYLEGFHLDLNLATSDAPKLFDREEGLVGLRRRGLFFMEQGLSSRRMNYPVELRHAGLELAVTLLAQQRYRLGFNHADFGQRREAVPLLLARGEHASASDGEARATHDGYFSLVVPGGDGDLGVGVLFGQRYSWIQIESVHLIAMSALHRDDESRHTEDAADRVILDGMVERGPGLFECTSPEAFLFLPPSGTGAEKTPRRACRIVYRPVAHRQDRPVPTQELAGVP